VLFVEVDERGVAVREDDGFHLARLAPPLRAAGHRAPSFGFGMPTPELPTFELVWPLKMDAAFERQVACAFAELAVRQRPAKRLLGELGEFTSDVGQKLRRLSFNP